MPFAGPQYSSPIGPTHTTAAPPSFSSSLSLSSSLSNLRWLHAIHEVPSAPANMPSSATHPTGCSHTHTPPTEDGSVPDIDDIQRFVPVAGAAVPTIPACPAPHRCSPATLTINLGTGATSKNASASAPGARKPRPSKAGTASDVLAAHLLPKRSPGSREYYAADRSARPPYSYAALIYMSMTATGKARVQLTEIYTNIIDQWAYYAARPRESGWKNSIRHNLTVSKCFSKVARTDGDTGKGGYWQINEARAQAEIVLEPREVPRHAPRSGKAGKSKSKKSKGVQPRDSKGGGGGGGGVGGGTKKKNVPCKSLPVPVPPHLAPTKQASLAAQLKRITEATAGMDDVGGLGGLGMGGRAIKVEVDDGSDDDAAMELEYSGLDGINYAFEGDLEHAMDQDPEQEPVVPDSGAVFLGYEDEDHPSMLMSHAMVDSSLLESSFSAFLGCTSQAKDLSASSSFSSFSSSAQIVQ